MSNLSEYADLTDNSVQIFLNGRLMAFAQECKIISSRNGRFVSGFGEGSSDGIALGPKGYTINLKRIVPSDDDIELTDMSSFEVIVLKQSRQLSFKKCQWIELSEAISKDNSVTESAMILSPELELKGVTL